MNDAELAALFAAERDETIGALEALIAQAEQRGWQQPQHQEAIRYAHSLKGAAAAMGERALSRLARMLEQTLKAIPLASGSAAASEPLSTPTQQWVVSFVPTPHTLASQALREEVDRLAHQWGCQEVPRWDETVQPPRWQATIAAPADAQRSLYQAFELFAVPGTLEVATPSSVAANPSSPVSHTPNHSIVTTCTPVSWHLPLAGTRDETGQGEVRLAVAVCHWQQCWRIVRPGWPIVLEANRQMVSEALARQLADAFAQIATRLPESPPPVRDAHLRLAFARQGALLTLAATGPSALLTPFVEALTPIWQALRGVLLAEQPGQWQGALPWAPGQLWAFWLRVGAEQIAVAAETVEAFYPAPHREDCRYVAGRWYATAEQEPLPWVPLPIASAAQAPADYALMPLVRVGSSRFLTGADAVEPAGSLTVTPIDAAMPNYWSAWAVAGGSLAPVLEPTLWLRSSFPDLCR